MAERKVVLRVRRQDGPERPETRRWETFAVPYVPRMTVVSALLEIRRHPVTTRGAVVTPVAWDCNCLEEACGACAMTINGRAALACSAFVDALSPKGKPIVLEPLRKFPLVRDLAVDRGRIFDALKRVAAFVTLDGGPAAAGVARQSQAAQQRCLPLGRCLSCGCCLEACPQYGDHSDFVGAAALNEVCRLNLHPTGALEREARLEAVMGPGGVTACGKAQNCVEVCPVGIPLVDSIQRVARDTSRRLWCDWLLG